MGVIGVALPVGVQVFDMRRHTGSGILVNKYLPWAVSENNVSPGLISKHSSESLPHTASNWWMDISYTILIVLYL